MVSASPSCHYFVMEMVLVVEEKDKERGSDDSPTATATTTTDTAKDASVKDAPILAPRMLRMTD